MPAPHPARTPLARALRRHLLVRPDLVPPGARVLVALSGGRDSVVLLHLLRFAGVTDCVPLAAHFDHGMRPGSNGDRAWARGLARAWDVPFASTRSDRDLRSEAAARSARYDFLHEAARDLAVERVATAHHADDQVETVLFRILRGTGLPGLGGIPPRRGLLVRPLLPFSGRRLAAYAREVGLAWRQDPTNVDARFARNRLRHQVLPELEAAAPGIRRSIGRLSRRIVEAERVLHPLIREAERLAVRTEGDSFVLARDIVLAYDPWIRARIFRELLTHAGGGMDRSAARRLDRFVREARSGAVLELSGGFRLIREFGLLVLFRPIEPQPDRLLYIETVDGIGNALVGGRPVRVVWGREAGVPGAHTVALDRSFLRFPLTVRGWRPGDRIRLEYGTKKLKKLFAEHRLARSARNRVPVLADAAGQVLWVAGLAVASPAAARSGHRTLHLSVLE